MFIRPCFRRKNGKRHAYGVLVESYRSQRGPRQRVVAYLGELDEQGRLGVREAAEESGGRTDAPQQLFPQEEAAPRYVQVDTAAVRVEHARAFGGPWLAWQWIRRIGLDAFLNKTIPVGDEQICGSVMSLVLVIARLCQPSSELYVAEHFYGRTALPDLLGVPEERFNCARLRRVRRRRSFCAAAGTGVKRKRRWCVASSSASSTDWHGWRRAAQGRNAIR